MFLNFSKDYFLKRFLKNSLQNAKSNSLSNKINTVGVLIDESNFFEKEALIQELIKGGLLEQNSKVILYKDTLKKNEVYPQFTFCSKLLNWKAEIHHPELLDFMNQNFDLLISYYDVEKAILLKITSNSKAVFKIGFSSVDKRLNHLMINTNADNYQVFTHELFRYLRILNKL
jgi:hypothetical protein